MEHISEHRPSRAVPALSSLPESRDRWPGDAERAFEILLGQLNRWSRENDWPQINNTWIAEEAVRQEWGS